MKDHTQCPEQARTLVVWSKNGGPTYLTVITCISDLNHYCSREQPEGKKCHFGFVGFHSMVIGSADSGSVIRRASQYWEHSSRVGSPLGKQEAEGKKIQERPAGRQSTQGHAPTDLCYFLPCHSKVNLSQEESSTLYRLLPYCCGKAPSKAAIGRTG